MTGWLYSILKAVDFHWTVQEVLDTDERYPGLLDQMFEDLGWRYHARHGDD